MKGEQKLFLRPRALDASSPPLLQSSQHPPATGMTLGRVSGSESSPAVSFCSCCGAKMVPYLSDDDASAVMSKNQINQL